MLPTVGPTSAAGICAECEELGLWLVDEHGTVCDACRFAPETVVNRSARAAFVLALLVALVALLGILSTTAHADVLQAPDGGSSCVDSLCGDPLMGESYCSCNHGHRCWDSQASCEADARCIDDGGSSTACVAAVRAAEAVVDAGAPVPLDAGPVDAGPDVPLVAHLDAGQAAPFTGDLLNTAAERNLLAAAEHPDAGAPCAEPLPPASDSLDTALHIALVIVTAGTAVWVHQRVTH